MPDYTTKNLLDLDDLAAGRAEGIEARFGRSSLDAEHLGVSHFRYGAGVRAPYGHKHGTQEEIYVVISGSGRMRLDDDVIDLRAWDAIRVAPEVVRGLEGGPEGLEFIVIGSDRPPDGDGEMVHDWWTD